MSSFMSKFAAFAIKSSGFKKKVADPVRREQFLDKLGRLCDKPYRPAPYPYRSRMEKRIEHGFEVFHLNRGRKKKIIYLHGGAFCEPARVVHFVFCDRVSTRTDYEVIFPIYKRAPKSTFETTCEFLETTYRELLESTDPSDIVFMGDSSGGGLALSFAEYLNEIGLPQPRRIILLSPWLDISMDEPFPEELDRLDPSLQREYLTEAGRNWAGGTDVHDYRLSPIYGNVANLAPITLYIGTHEAILPEARKFKALCEQKGAALDYREWEDMNHVFVLYPIPEARRAQDEIIDLLNG